MKKSKQEISINISAASVWKIIGIIVLIFFLYFIRDVLLLLLLAIIISSAILPIVNKMEAKKIPRILTTTLIFLLFFGILSLVVYSIIPQLARESRQIVETLPQAFDSMEQFINKVFDPAAINSSQLSGAEKVISQLPEQTGNIISNIFSGTISSLGLIFQVIMVFALVFYMVTYKDGMSHLVNSTVPNQYRKYVFNLIERIEQKIGRWLLGQLALMLSVFALNLIILNIFDVPYATTIALIGGLMEIIPFLGPIVSTFLAVIAALTVSPWVAVFVGVSYLIAQQIQGNFLTPLVMSKAVGLSPVVIIIALFIGSKIGGFLGLFLAVPVATIMGVLINDVLNSKIIRDKKNVRKSAMGS
ncbi:MAG TPA: AI-2E family transporter [Candidatus Moranbacteria bacterium]|nr:AI-2E family transporter [Candidatus Moranbacteria bacterium]